MHVRTIAESALLTGGQGAPERRRATVAQARMVAVLLAMGPVLTACASTAPLPDAPAMVEREELAPDYRISPLDTLQVVVWESPEFTTTAPVRPDGRISVPMLQDLMAAGKTPEELSRDIKKQLSTFMRDALVTVTVTEFAKEAEQQVHVVGEAVKAAAIPYRSGMKVLDVMVAAGGLTKFADGNRAVLVRQFGGQEKSYRVHLNDLLKGGATKANVPLLPGDILIIPESYF
jgi:polysaccharide export outer membrane protein